MIHEKQAINFRNTQELASEATTPSIGRILSIRAKSIPSSALKDLVESYQHRILSLEIELRQMRRDGLINAAAFKKRVLILRQLKDCLQKLQQQAASSSHPDVISGQKDDLPAPDRCTPEEAHLCLRYLSEVYRFICSLQRESNDVIKAVQKAIKGRPLSFLTTMDLSRLRKKLMAIENRQSELSQNKKQWDGFIQNVLQASQKMQIAKQKSALHALKYLFHHLDEIGTQIIRLRLQIEKAEEELNWMEHWLSFQEFHHSQQSFSSLPSTSPLSYPQTKTKRSLTR